MTESGYQKKIIKAIEEIGGVAINGKYTTAGTADLICGYPKEVGTYLIPSTVHKILLHLHIEVKTEDAYNKLFKKNIKEVDGYYEIDDNFNGREVLQASKLNAVRRQGGLALFAWNFQQVQEYVNEHY